MAWPYDHYPAFYGVLVNKKALNIDLRLNYLKMCDQKASRYIQLYKQINKNTDADFHDWVRIKYSGAVWFY